MTLLAPPSHIEQFVSALLYLRDTAALQHLGLGMAKCALQLNFK